MTKQAGYTWVKRASWEQYAEMLSECAGENEIVAKEHYDDPHTCDWVYKVGRAGAGHGTAYTLEIWQKGERIESGSFVRCTACGGIRALFEGQGEFCADCFADWE